MPKMNFSLSTSVGCTGLGGGIIPTDPLLVKLPELALGAQHIQIKLLLHQS
jgi:hypothetical protein